MNGVRIITPEETKQIRNIVLWPHLNSPEECTLDVDTLPDTFHIGAELDGEIVATSTVIRQQNEKFEQQHQYRLRAMGTLPKVRGRNYGKQVIELILEELKNRHADLLWCDARKVALGFYERMGFSVTGDFYNVRNIGPHKLMYKEINEPT